MGFPPGFLGKCTGCALQARLGGWKEGTWRKEGPMKGGKGRPRVKHIYAGTLSQMLLALGPANRSFAVPPSLRH